MSENPIGWLHIAAQNLVSRMFPARHAKQKARAVIASLLCDQPPSTGQVTLASIASGADRSLDDRGQPIRHPAPGAPVQAGYPVFHEGPLECDERQPAVARAFLALPLLTRQIFFLSQRGGMNGGQISCLLGLSRHAVRRHLRRAVAALLASSPHA